MKIRNIDKLAGVIFLGLVFILVGGLRWETGTDWINYHHFFTSNDSYQEFIGSPHEYLYSLLSYAVKQLSESYTVFLLIFCFLTITLKLYGFCKLSNYDYIFLTILFYYANQLGDVSSNRQSIALSFSVIGLVFMINKNLFLFLVTSFTAMYFHTSAVILFLAIPLIYIEFSRKKVILIIVAGFFIGLFISVAGSSLVFNYLMSGDGRIADKLTAYDEIAEMGNGTTGSSIDPKISYLLGTIRRCFVIIPALLFYNKLAKRKHFKILINIYILGSLIFLIFSPIMQVLNRLSAYFDVTEFLILPMFVTIPNRGWIKFGVYMVLVLFAFAKFYSTIISFWTFYTPYKLCF